MARGEQPNSVHPPDPLNSYQEASFSGWFLTAMAILIAVAVLWLAFSAAPNNPDLRREMDGRQDVQGPIYQDGVLQPGDI